MCPDQNSRKKMMDSHIVILKEGCDAIEESEKHVEKEIEEGKTTLYNLQRAKNEINKELELLISLDTERSDALDDTTWANYEIHYTKNKNLCASICDYRDSLKQTKPLFSPTLSGSFATSGVSGGHTAFILFNGTPVETKEFTSTAAKHEMTKQPIELFDLVCAEIVKIDKGMADRFKKLVTDFLGSASDIQYTRLIDIRSFVFDQLFETLCPESDYSKTDWFANAGSGSVERRKRYCQSMYFILGNALWGKLSTPVQKRVANVCKDMFDLFGSLSNYGKHGIDDKQTQYYFNETIGTFAETIQMRDKLYSA